MVDDNIPKKPRSVTHLKKFQFGQPGRPKGRPSGAKSKKAALTAEILTEAFLVDPDTGAKMNAKQLRRKLSRKIWTGSDKVLLDVIARKLGPVINTQQIVNLPTFNIISNTPSTPEHVNGEGNIEIYTLPTPTVDTKFIEDKDK